MCPLCVDGTIGMNINDYLYLHSLVYLIPCGANLHLKRNDDNDWLNFPHFYFLFLLTGSLLVGYIHILSIIKWLRGTTIKYAWCHKFFVQTHTSKIPCIGFVSRSAHRTGVSLFSRSGNTSLQRLKFSQSQRRPIPG